MSELAISYGQRTIRFTLEQKPRKTFKISVLPDLSVGVSAPSRLTVEKVLNTVQRRAPWIAKQMEYFKTFMPKQPPRQFISGETHYYLGRQYRLKVEPSKTPDIKLKGKYLIAQVNRPNVPVKKLVYDWYRVRAKEIFGSVVDRCHSKLHKYGIGLPRVEIKTMKSRWGSCTHAKNKISLNTELIKAPSHCIEYVVMHEMCHLKYPNHTKHFYNFMSLAMPDWQTRKNRLEKVIL